MQSVIARVKSMRVLFYDCQLFTTIRCIMTMNVYRKPLPGVQQFFNHYHIYGGTHSSQVINDCKQEVSDKSISLSLSLNFSNEKL